MSGHVLELHSGHNMVLPLGKDIFVHYLREKQAQTLKKISLVTTLNTFWP